MADNLAIVAGFGALSQEVDVLAALLPMNYTRYTIKPWFPLSRDPIRRFTEFVRQTNRVTGLNPFYFSDIQREFQAKEITQVFLTGDFPPDRFWQARIGEALPALFKIADSKCVEYFDATPKKLSKAVRYFLALGQLLADLKITPLLASRIFPSLNLSTGCLSGRSIPQSILDNMPSVVANTVRALGEVPQDQNRFSQAVIVDRNIIWDVEAKGTNDLLNRYGSKAKNCDRPFLLKLPSPDFTPELDQPTIGPDTITLCNKVGIQGIVVCAETTIVAQKAITIEQINSLDMFLYALPFNQLREVYLRHSPNSWVQTATTDLRLR